MSTRFLPLHRSRVLFVFLCSIHHRHQEITPVSSSSSLVRRFICSLGRLCGSEIAPISSSSNLVCCLICSAGRLCDSVLQSVEFQKRGLPHIHVLIWLQDRTGAGVTELADTYISAEIPDPVVDPLGYALVEEFMMHGPCGRNRFRLCLEGTDGTAAAEFVFFNRVAQQLVGKSVMALLRSSGLPREIAAVVSQKYTLAVSVTQKSLSQRNISFQVNGIETFFGRQNSVAHDTRSPTVMPLAAPGASSSGHALAVSTNPSSADRIPELPIVIEKKSSAARVPIRLTKRKEANGSIGVESSSKVNESDLSSDGNTDLGITTTINEQSKDIDKMPEVEKTALSDDNAAAANNSMIDSTATELPVVTQDLSQYPTPPKKTKFYIDTAAGSEPAKPVHHGGRKKTTNASKTK